MSYPTLHFKKNKSGPDKAVDEANKKS